MLRSCFARVNVATIGELLEAVMDIGVRLLACEMTMEVFGYREADCIDRVEFGGAATLMLRTLPPT
jgi:peroxiredoxin family protein